ncbi:hypothetical protein FORC066_0987 [Yersinia enterocolitica]|nr:hypothetical protein FORC066_0987 [Yersinia enterocolitica]
MIIAVFFSFYKPVSLSCSALRTCDKTSTKPKSFPHISPT